MKALTIGLMLLGLLGIAVVGIGAENEEVSQEARESSIASEDFLIQKGPALIAEGNYNRVLDLIEDLPEKARNNIQIRTLECFANLKGWVSAKDQVSKTNWWGLRLKLMHLGDNEPAQILVIFLKDEDPYLRKYAAELLGYVGDEKALDDLREVGKNDENRGVRKYAKWAYKQISGGFSPVASGLPPLVAPRVQIPVKMDVAGPIDTSKSISFVNSTSEFKIMLLASIEYKKYYADFESWADIIIDQLENELRKRGVKVNASQATSANRVVIGVLDIEMSGTDENPHEVKDALMGELRKGSRVKLVDIHEASSLSDLKKNGYEQAERYKSEYQLDMILHVNQVSSTYYFSLIDLYSRKVKEVSIGTEGISIENRFRGISYKVLAIGDIRRALRAKKEILGIKEVQVKPDTDYIFNVSVQDVKLVQGAWATRCIVNVRVERGDGTWSKTYEGNNASPATIERAVDGAVYRVVEAIIADSGFRKKISR